MITKFSPEINDKLNKVLIANFEAENTEFIKNQLEELIEKNEFTEEEIIDSLEVLDWALFLLEKDAPLIGQSYPQFKMFITAAALLHNIEYSYGEETYEKIFYSRRTILESLSDQDTKPFFEAYVIPIIESQLGRNIPISGLIPNPGTPADILATACLIYYKKIKK